MHIYEIKYSRGRTVQPRAYESDRIDVELTAQLVEGEDVKAAIKVLRGLVAVEVGREAGKTVETTSVKELADHVAAEKKTASEVAGGAPAAETATEAAVEVDKKAEAKKARADKKAAKKVEKTAETTTPAREATGDIQDEELVSEAAKAAATILPLGVKDIMTDFGVPRLSVIAQDKRPEFVARLHKAVADHVKANTADDNEIPL